MTVEAPESQTFAPPPPPPLAPPSAVARGKRKLTRWAIPAAVAIIGLAIGAAIGSGVADPTASGEYKALATDLATTKAANTDLGSQLADTKSKLDSANITLSDAVVQLEAANEKLGDLQSKQKQVAEREAAVKEREDAVQKAEDTQAANTVTEGTWTVGVDISAGTYRLKAPADKAAMCYWSITRTGSNGDDIISNDIVTGGRPSVRLSKGQDFTTQDCGDWIRQ